MVTTTNAPAPAPAGRAPLRPSLRAGLVLATAVSAVVFVALAVVVWHHHGHTVPSVVTTAPTGVRLQRVAWLGSPQFVFTVAGVMALVALVRRDVFTAVLWAAGPALAGLCGIGAKHLVGRTSGGELSYPSGHATLVAALVAVIAVLAFRAVSWRMATAVSVVLAVVPVAVCVALVRLGWHFRTDVVGGVALGVGVVCGLALVLDRVLTSPKIRTN